eukprot:1369622-Amorphochlora_amoeboformis.AAC.1
MGALKYGICKACAQNGEIRLIGENLFICEFTEHLGFAGVYELADLCRDTIVNLPISQTHFRDILPITVAGGPASYPRPRPLPRPRPPRLPPRKRPPRLMTTNSRRRY